MNKRKKYIVRWLRRNAGWHFGSMIASGAKVDLRHVFDHLNYLVEIGLVEKRDEPAPWPNQDKGGLPRQQFRAAPVASKEGADDVSDEP